MDKALQTKIENIDKDLAGLWDLSFRVYEAIEALEDGIAGVQNQFEELADDLNKALKNQS